MRRALRGDVPGHHRDVAGFIDRHGTLYCTIKCYHRMGDSNDVVFCAQEAPFAVAFKDAGMGWAESFISFGGGFILTLV